MWYQALNDNAPDYVHQMFASLVPGFATISIALHNQIGGGASVFHDTSAQQPVVAAEMLPILPPSSGDKNPDHVSKFYLESLLECMVHTVVKLEWHDKESHQYRSFNFLLEKFKEHYMPKICPGFCEETSLYRPNLGNIL